VQAADGHAGLAMVEGIRPDLLLVDFAMPGIDGAEIARQVRERHPRLPIVFVTGYADTVAIEKAVGPGAMIVKKPFRASELQWVIAEAIRSVG
jgi:CheY-like chemotaxis protein